MRANELVLRTEPAGGWTLLQDVLSLVHEDWTPATLVSRIHASQGFSPSDGEGQHLATADSSSVRSENKTYKVGLARRAACSPHGMRTWTSAPLTCVSRATAHLSRRHTQ